MSGAYDRLSGDYYNSDAKTDLNPGGMAAGGHVTNFPAALDDTATVTAEAAASAAAAVVAQAAAAASAASAVNAPGTSATSTSSVAIGTGSKSFTLAQTGKAFAIGQTVVAADDAAPGTNRMIGEITAFNAGTGAMTINVAAGMAFGSGTKTAWTISLSGVGPAFLGGSLSTALNEAGATVASHATTAAIWAAAGNLIDFTGTATMTDFPDAPQAGARRTLIIAAACTFTHNANIFVPGGANYTAAAGDVVHVIAITVSTFRLEITRVGGRPVLTAGLVYIGAVSPSGGATARFTGISGIYSSLVMVLRGISDSAGAALALDKADNGAGFAAVISTIASLSAGAAYDGVIEVFNYAATSGTMWITGSVGSSGGYAGDQFGRTLTAPNVMTGLGLSVASGTFDAGSVELWGRY